MPIVLNSYPFQTYYTAAFTSLVPDHGSHTEYFLPFPDTVFPGALEHAPSSMIPTLGPEYALIPPLPATTLPVPSVYTGGSSTQ